MLGSVPDDDVIIVADLEAGIGTITRLPDASVDLTVVVVEPTPRSIDVATRAKGVADDRSQGRIVVVANKVADHEDRERIVEAFPDGEIVWVPHDATVDDADRRGTAPSDAASSRAVDVLTAFAERLV